MGQGNLNEIQQSYRDTAQQQNFFQLRKEKLQNSFPFPHCLIYLFGHFKVFKFGQQISIFFLLVIQDLI